MINLAAGAGNTVSSIPFWLQIVSIAAAPILGFVGVAVGVALNERNRRRAYFIEEKKKAYLEFINTLAAIHAFWANEMSSTLRNSNSRTADEATIFSKSQVEALNRTFSQILLFGSQSAIETGQKCFSYILTTSLTAMVMLTRGLDQRRWDKIAGEAIELMMDFSSIARKDLGLPELPQKTYVQDIELEKKMDETINKFFEDRLREAKEKGSAKSKTDRNPGDAQGHESV